MLHWKTAVNHPLPGPSARQQLSRVLLAAGARFRTADSGAAWQAAQPLLRERALRQVYLRHVPDAIAHAPPRVEWGEVIEPAAPYRIRKLRYEAWPGYWIPALLYEPENLTGRAPAVLNTNGHHRGGKAAGYKQIRCANLARRGMLALNTEFIGQGELEADDDHNLAAHLSLAGISGVALFYLAMKRGLDVLLAHPQADPQRVAMTGLSGGGWQTIVLSALDPRVRAVIPVAGYTALWARLDCISDIGDYEQAPPDLATVLDYDTMTALLAPRPTLLVLNARDDCCFRTDRTKPVIYDAIRPTFEQLGAGDRFCFHSNEDPGTHNYEADNRSQLYRFLNRIFDQDWPLSDLHDDADIYPETALNVGLPEAQLTLSDLARQQARRRSSELETPTTPAAKQRLRQRLQAILRLPDYPAEVLDRHGTGRIRQLSLRVGPWTLPIAIRQAKRQTRAAVLLLHDHGMTRFADWPTADEHQAAADLSFLGHLADDFRRNLLLEAAGQRLLGIQVAQCQAVIRTLCRELNVASLRLEAHGCTASAIAMLAAALEPMPVAALHLSSNLTSFRLLIEKHINYRDAPSLFCPDLLRIADVPQLMALLAGTPVHEHWRATLPTP